MERTGWHELPLCLLSMNTDTPRRACGEAACRLWPESVNLEVAADVSGLCSSRVGSGTIKDGTAEAWRDPHPGAYKNLTLNTGQHLPPRPPFSALGNRTCGRRQLPSWLSLSW